MNNDLVFKNVIKVIKGINPNCLDKVDIIDENINLAKDLDFDSMEYLMLASSLEEQFDLILRKEDILNLKTIKDVVEYIKQAKNK